MVMWGQAQQMLSVRFMRHVIVGSFEHAHPAVSARLNSAAAAVRDVPGNKSGLITRNDSADTKHKISYRICMCVCVCVCVCVYPRPTLPWMRLALDTCPQPAGRMQGRMQGQDFDLIP